MVGELAANNQVSVSGYCPPDKPPNKIVPTPGINCICAPYLTDGEFVRDSLVNAPVVLIVQVSLIGLFELSAPPNRM